MERAAAILAIITTLGTATTARSGPVHGIGPGQAVGLAAGALIATAPAGKRPYYYGYSGPRYYYGPAPVYSYGPGPYTYYGGPYYYRHRYWYRPYW
jgi:hypothetical protein